MKLYSPSTLHLRQPFSSLFSASFSTDINPPSLLQTVINQIKLLSKNPQNCSSLTTIDSLLAKTHLLDSATSLVLIDYLSQINKLGRCKTVISHLKSKGRVSDPFLYSLVYDFIVKNGKINDVDNVWAEICGGSVKSFDFSNYVILVCKFGGIDEIKDVYERILTGVAVERQSYVALCAALCNINEGILAKNVVKEMYDKGISVDNWTYFMMFKCFCRIGIFQEADLVLRKLVKSGFVIDISIYGTFLHGLCNSGKYREANKLFRKLIITRVPVKGFNERNLVLKEGRRVIFQLNCEGVIPEMMVYESYFRALCKANKLDEAQVLLKKMISGTTLPEICVYGSFIKALFRAGRDEDAVKFFKNQRKKGLVRADEIGGYVIMGLCENGKADYALRLFEEIKTVNGFVNGSHVCNSVLKSFWEESCVTNAERFFEKWRLNEGKYGKLNVTTYTNMLNGYCSHNNVLKATVIFEDMLNKKMVVDGVLYEQIISLLCGCGRVNEAFRYLNHMIENGHFLFCKRWRALFQSILSTDERCVLIGS